MPYFISSHPKATLNDAIELASYLKSINYMPLQVQDFYPTPSTRATCMYYTELDNKTFKPIYVAKSQEDKLMQRALMQYRKKENYKLILKALQKANRQDRIGFEPHCLIKPTKEMAIANKQKKSVRLFFIFIGCILLVVQQYFCCPFGRLEHSYLLLSYLWFLAFDKFFVLGLLRLNSLQVTLLHNLFV